MAQDTVLDEEEYKSLSHSIILLQQYTNLWGNTAVKFELLPPEVEMKTPKYMHSKFILWPMSFDLIKNSEETLCLCLGRVCSCSIQVLLHWQIAMQPIQSGGYHRLFSW